MSSQRYRIFLVEDAAGALVPVRGQRRRRHSSRVETPSFQDDLLALNALLGAVRRLTRRGQGPSAWAPVHRDPISFLLDTMSDALVVRGLDGEVLFANPVAEQLGLQQRNFAAYEEFELGEESYLARGLRVELPQGPLTFTVVTRVRK